MTETTTSPDADLAATLYAYGTAAEIATWEALVDRLAALEAVAAAARGLQLDMDGKRIAGVTGIGPLIDALAALDALEAGTDD